LLLLGMDNRHDRVTGRTDTMVVAAFRERDGSVAAFSIPRDLWVELPDDLGPARISSTVRIGNVKLGEGQGVPLLRRVLDDQLGIRVDRYAAVDLQGFVRAVDALGGVDVDVPCPIIDCFWDGPGTAATDRSSCETLRVDAGRQHLDGATALQYARSRHGRGDRDRTRRQQALLVALARTVERGGLGRLPRLWDAVRPHVQTDLEWDSAAYFASFALEADLAQIGGFSIRHPMTRRHVTQERKHVLLLDPEAYERALRGMFRSTLPGLGAPRRCPAPDVALHFRKR
jgi:LCP family protein required for cell wall assembly